jgi:hypothetical protein
LGVAVDGGFVLGLRLRKRWRGEEEEEEEEEEEGREESMVVYPPVDETLTTLVRVISFFYKLKRVQM